MLLIYLRLCSYCGKNECVVEDYQIKND